MDTSEDTNRHAAIILAGGSATRMGGVPKPELLLGGRPLLLRVLDAVPDARPRIVVGDVAKRDFVLVTEQPPRSGPAYALAAGLSHVPTAVSLVMVLAGDLPFLNHAVTTALRQAVTDEFDGAVLVDHNDRRQWLCGAWRHTVLASRLNGVIPGTGVRQALGDLNIAEVSWLDDNLPPWFDCDTPAALEYARKLDRELGTG